VNRRRRELLAALQPAVDAVMAKCPPGERASIPGLAVRNDGGARELMIYGRIGGGGWFDDGIGASDIAAALRELGSGHVDVRINSGGGDVFDGVAIHSLLARHSGGVTTHIDGLAASAASFIAMAGDRVVMARNAFIMIHDGMTMTYGNGNTHRASAELLDMISNTIADIYAERAGEDVEHWRNLMTVNGEDGTWYSGQDALSAGLVDELTGQPDEDAPDARLLSGWSDVLPERIVALLPKRQSTEQQESESTSVAEQDSDEDYRYRMTMWQWSNGHTAREESACL